MSPRASRRCPYGDNSIDCISSNSLFEHVPYPHDILRGAFRVLRAGGALRTTVPFHFVEHGCPKDYLQISHADAAANAMWDQPNSFWLRDRARTRCVGPANASQRPSRRQHERDGRPCVWRMPAPPSLLGLFATRYPSYFEQIGRRGHLPTDPKPLQGTRPYFIATRRDLTLFTCHGATGNHGVRCYHHQWFLRLPLNPLECG